MNDTLDDALESPSRAPHLAKGLRLEYLTVGWNVVEGIIALGAALAAGSVALFGFGIDSFIESLSGGILIWRLHAERSHRDPEGIEALDERAHKLVGISLFVLGAYIVFDAALSLWRGDRPEVSVVGISLTVLSIVVMQWLARAKRRVATDLNSKAMRADAFQTSACFWLSVVALCGITLNAAVGWWWADPVAALGMAFFIVREGIEAWRGEDCCEQRCGNAQGGSCRQ